MKLRYFSLLLLGLLTLPACSNSGANAELMRELADAPTGEVRKGPFVVTLEEVGVLSAARREEIRPPFRGKVLKIAEDGVFVEANEPILWMDVQGVYDEIKEEIAELRAVKADLERNLEDIRMSLKRDQLDLESAAARLEFDQLKLIDVNRELQNLETLQEARLVAQRNVDRALINVEQSKMRTRESDINYQKEFETRESTKLKKSMDLDKLNYRRTKAIEDIEEEQEKIDLAIVRAPISGIFLLEDRWSWRERDHVTVSPGDEVSSRQIVGFIPDMSSLQILSQVSEALITRIELGMNALVTMDAFPEMEIDAEISEIGMVAVSRDSSPAGKLAENQGDSTLKVFEITMKPGEIDERLRPGMTANVSLILGRRDDVLSAPLECIFSVDGRRVAFVKTPEGFEEREVSIGQRNSERVIVKSGLREGEILYAINLAEEDSTEQEEASAAVPGLGS